MGICRTIFDGVLSHRWLPFSSLWTMIPNWGKRSSSLDGVRWWVARTAPMRWSVQSCILMFLIHKYFNVKMLKWRFYILFANPNLGMLFFSGAWQCSAALERSAWGKWKPEWPKEGDILSIVSWWWTTGGGGALGQFGQRWKNGQILEINLCKFFWLLILFCL